MNVFDVGLGSLGSFGSLCVLGKPQQGFIINEKKSGFLPNVSFSPESGGSVKPSKAIEEISTHGTIKLKK
jgi:hypothetical protein